MKVNAIATVALVSTSAAALAVQRRSTLDWQVTGFSVESVDDGPTNYKLNITGEGLSSACQAQNSVASSTCPGANGPAPFTTLLCGPEYISAPSFSWEFQNGTSPLKDGGAAYSIKFTYAENDQQKIYGCSGQLLASDTSCVGPPGEGEILHVPSTLTVTEAINGECIYT